MQGENAGGDFGAVLDFLGNVGGKFFAARSNEAQIRAAQENARAQQSTLAQNQQFTRQLLSGLVLGAIALVVAWRATR